MVINDEIEEVVVSTINDPEWECEFCDGTGHLDICEARDKAEDIGDLIAMCGCDGCCPNGCKPSTMSQLQYEARKKVLGLLESLDFLEEVFNGDEKST